jgi:RimJ/RimL family protein N-acetyltransferase
MSVDDSVFMLELLNDPSWLKFIGDRGARTVDDAREYILTKVIAMYENVGFGLFLTELKSDGTPIGICGLIKRDSLEDVDIGFAFLPKFRGRGYAYESAAALINHGKRVLGLDRIVAITSADNDRSVALLKKLGLSFERMVRLYDGGKEDMLFALNV